MFVNSPGIEANDEAKHATLPIGDTDETILTVEVPGQKTGMVVSILQMARLPLRLGGAKFHERNRG